MSSTQQALAFGRAIPATRLTRQKWRGGLQGSEFVWAMAFVVPYVAIFLAFVIYPLGYGLWLGSEPALYSELFSDPIYLSTVTNTLQVTAQTPFPAPLTLLGQVQTTPSATTVALYGNLAYVAGTNGIDIVNISDPNNPTVVSTFAGNLSVGGAGGAGGSGGDGEGGGVLCDDSSALTVKGSTLIQNVAVGGLAGAGVAGGEGEGGGIYILPGGAVCLSPDTIVTGNHASTVGDDIFGPFTIC